MKYHKLYPQERASLRWELDKKTGGPTLWVKEKVIMDGKRKHIWHWVVDASLFKDGEPDNKNGRIGICCDTNNMWQVIPIWNARKKRVEIVRRSKTIVKIGG